MSAGKPLPHDSAPLHVTGNAPYVADLPDPPGCLHLAFGTSTEACGEITGIDLEAVMHAPGVALVLTAEALERRIDVSPAAGDEPLLATGDVHFHGQPVFLVAADSHHAARAAARRGLVELRPRKPVLTIDDALAADSRLEPPLRWEKGDVDAALAAAEHVVSGQIEIGGQEHFYLEGHAAMAVPGEAGEMVIHSATQGPTTVQQKVAEALGRPMSKVRVEIRRMGGGFGGKESQATALAVACAVVAERTGRPARMRYDRDDDMTITGKRHDFRIRYRAGCDHTGKLVAVDFTHYIRGGWSADLTAPVADRAMLNADNAYFVPAMRIESHRLRTNTASATAFRGFGGPQGALGIERVIDHIAHDLGRDPLLIRRKNLYTKTKVQKTHYGQEVRDNCLSDIVKTLAASARYDEHRARIADWNARHTVLRKGLALTPVKFGISFTLKHLNQASALVHVYHDGSIRLNHGGTEMGQGLNRKVAQVVARAFGVGADAVRITATDTALVPNSSATAASSGSDLNGMAALDACTRIKDRMVKFLAKSHKVKPRLIAFEGGQVRLGKRRMSFAEAVQECYEGRVSLSCSGFYKTPGVAWDREKGKGHPFYYFAMGAALTEVVVDTLTGEYRILRADILHDTGDSLNPALDIGQIEGGYVQGAGWLTTEELVWDAQGRLATHAPSTYKIPTASDAPEMFNVTLWGQPNDAPTIHRSKGVGEPPFLLGISAFFALSDAIGSEGPGYPALDAPATPERVLMATKRVRG